MVTEHIIIKSFQDITNSGIFSNVGGFLKLESHFPKKVGFIFYNKKPL